MLEILFSPKSFVFPSNIKKPKDKSIQNCNFASCAVWVRNLVSHFEEGTQTEGFENRVLRRIKVS
jgi:hypothetical protein